MASRNSHTAKLNHHIFLTVGDTFTTCGTVAFKPIPTVHHATTLPVDGCGPRIGLRSTPGVVTVVIQSDVIATVDTPNATLGLMLAQPNNKPNIKNFNLVINLHLHSCIKFISVINTVRDHQ